MWWCCQWRCTGGRCGAVGGGAGRSTAVQWRDCAHWETGRSQLQHLPWNCNVQTLYTVLLAAWKQNYIARRLQNSSSLHFTCVLSNTFSQKEWGVLDTCTLVQLHRTFLILSACIIHYVMLYTAYRCILGQWMLQPATHHLAQWKNWLVNWATSYQTMSSCLERICLESTPLSTTDSNHSSMCLLDWEMVWSGWGGMRCAVWPVIWTFPLSLYSPDKRCVMLWIISGCIL